MKHDEKDEKIEDMPDNKLNIVGESVSFDEISKYFIDSRKSTDIDAMLMFREAEKELKKGKGDNFRWIVYLAVLFVAAAIAVYILLPFIHSGGGSPIDYNALANAIHIGGANINGTLMR